MYTSKPIISFKLCSVLLVMLMPILGCGSSGNSRQDPTTLNFPITPASGEIDVVNAFPNLAFEAAVYITNAGDGSNRLFVVQQGGKILVFNNQTDVANATVFLDLSNIVTFDGEEGLLGLTFDPNYASNGKFYVYYSAPNPRRTVVARYTVSAQNPNQANAVSAEIILEIPQPYANHNGGTILFGPDGYLYVGLGDGGAGGDPQGHGQNTQTLLGSLLRIDPNSGTPYAIPTDNPFSSTPNGERPEIWAYGLRNPTDFLSID